MIETKAIGETLSLSYDINHKNQPIKLSAQEDKIIKDLLWYLPNNSSAQRSKIPVWMGKVYGSALVTFFFSQMGMHADSDYKEYSNKIDPQKLAEAKAPTIFLAQQKAFYINNQKGFSKLEVLFFHIRNSIAHGRFNVTNGYFFGFDVNKKDFTPFSEETAVFVFDIAKLNTTLKRMCSPMLKALFFKQLFMDAGFMVRTSQHIECDFIVEKKRRYAISIKDFQGQRYLHLKDLKGYLDEISLIKTSITRVLIIDTSRITKEVTKAAKRIKNLFILDLRHLNDLLEPNGLLRFFE